MKKDEIKYVWTAKKGTFLGLPLSFTRYFLTETKFITRTGVLSINEDEIDLYKIIDKKVRIPFGQRLVGCGTIILYSKDADSPTKEIRCIKNVRKVSELINKHMNIMRDRYGIRGRDMMGYGGGAHYGDDYDDHDGHDDGENY